MPPPPRLASEVAPAWAELPSSPRESNESLSLVRAHGLCTRQTTASRAGPPAGRGASGRGRQPGPRGALGATRPLSALASRQPGPSVPVLLFAAAPARSGPGQASPEKHGDPKLCPRTRPALSAQGLRKARLRLFLILATLTHDLPAQVAPTWPHGPQAVPPF